MPRRVSRLPAMVSRWGIVPKRSGKWDAAFDIWFRRTAATGPPNGTEILIMLSSHNLPVPGDVKSIVTIAGIRWYEIVRTVKLNGHTWNYVQFRRVAKATTFHSPLRAFFTQAERVKALRKGWFLTSVQAGFEVWRGGVGLTAKNVFFVPKA